MHVFLFFPTAWVTYFSSINDFDKGKDLPIASVADGLRARGILNNHASSMRKPKTDYKKYTICTHTVYSHNFARAFAEERVQPVVDPCVLKKHIIWFCLQHLWSHQISCIQTHNNNSKSSQAVPIHLPMRSRNGAHVFVCACVCMCVHVCGVCMCVECNRRYTCVRCACAHLCVRHAHTCAHAHMYTHA